MATCSDARFVVGIDLGTTHTVVAASPVDRPEISVFPIAQLVAAGEVAALDLLPSFLYTPAEGELIDGATKLPWNRAAVAMTRVDWAIGEFARRQGAQVPGRLVYSAKSWLSYAGVDRAAAILPWGAAEDVPRLSPVEASARVLEHARNAWDQAHPDAPLSRQDVVLTVPASFDEVARELTVEAAERAGIGRLRLIEEPQAAFYDFLQHHENDLEKALGSARLVLVVDVGGGTTDLTLVRVVRPSGGGTPTLERIAVGDHLMLGGDNMDVTLARHVEMQLFGKTGTLDATRWSGLVQAARLAKETLLSGHGPDTYGVAVMGRGARLLGGGQSYTLARAEAEQILLEGFLPRVAADQELEKRGRVALTELSLPFAADPAVSRHVSSFLRRHAETAARTGVTVVNGVPRPDALLLNGGVFNGPRVVERLAEVLAGWFPGETIPLLTHQSLDLAVARGAAYHGLVRRGFGVRITGGSARSYYLGVAGDEERRHAVCVAPRGMEEGAESEVPGVDLKLLLGRPVAFPLYTSTSDRVDPLGALIDVTDELEPLPPLCAVLGGAGAGRSSGAASARGVEGGEVAVRLATHLTEVGTLEIALKSTTPPERRFRLRFAVRGEGGRAGAAVDELPRRFPDARNAIERLYGKRDQTVDPKEIKNLRRNVEQLIGQRDSWSAATSRELWGVLWDCAGRRRRTAQHERLWFQLAGFCLRPGYGVPLDDWRVGEMWNLFEGGVQHTADAHNWSEWWILWRRIAGGLSAEAQRVLLESARPWLEPPKTRSPPKPRGPKAEGHLEMERMVVSLERIAAREKADVGEWVLARRNVDSPLSWWPLGRLGTRQPLYASAHDVVPADVAARWVERLLALDWRKAEGAGLASAMIARMTGDRERDLPEALRLKVAERLTRTGGASGWARMVREVVALDAQEETQVFGDTLPPGLRLA